MYKTLTQQTRPLYGSQGRILVEMVGEEEKKFRGGVVV
jgi:hypothetical protein